MCEIADDWEPLARNASRHPPNPGRDAQLMRDVAQGDRTAFRYLYETHRPKMLRLAIGVLVDTQKARDVVQEAFLRLFLQAPRWHEGASVSTWLYRVVLNECLSIKRRMRYWLRARFDTPRAPSPEREAAAHEALTAVLASLGTLSPRARAVVTLYLDGNLSPAEIAPLIGLSSNATRVTLHRGLEKLRADLRAVGIDSVELDEAWSNVEEPPL